MILDSHCHLDRYEDAQAVAAEAARRGVFTIAVTNLPSHFRAGLPHIRRPGHDQDALSAARVIIAGAGGLASWAAAALTRSGLRNLSIADHDVFDRTNASRQPMFGHDIRQPKAFAFARNLAPHMVAGGVITAIQLPFAEAIERYLVPADLLIVLVDNNRCRFDAVQISGGSSAFQ